MSPRTTWVLVLMAAACGPRPAPAPTPSETAVVTPAPAETAAAETAAAEPPGETEPPVVEVPPPTGDRVGTAHPLVVEAAARDGAWIVICQARTDSDGDGDIAVHIGMHGDTWGDAFTPYLVRGSGDGEPLESFVGATRDGRWVVAKRNKQLAVLDVRAGTWTELKGADLRDDGVPLGPHRAASIARGGDRMTYFRDDDTIVIRELATGKEQDVKVKGAKLWRVEVAPRGTVARVYAITTDSDKDGKLSWPIVSTSLSDRDCRGPIMSYSTGGWSGDKPDELWLDLVTGKMLPGGVPPSSPAMAALPDEEDFPAHLGRPVYAVDASGRRLLGPTEGEGRDIPVGPLTWTK